MNEVVKGVLAWATLTVEILKRMPAEDRHALRTLLDTLIDVVPHPPD